jgi:hypothetical protein
MCDDTEPNNLPTPRTGAYAILIAMGRESKKPDYPGYMLKRGMRR